MGKSTSELRAYVDGRDPVTGKPVMEEVVEALTKPLSDADDELIPMFRLDEIEVVVVGGETNGYWRIMGCNYEKTVSTDEWR